MKLLLKLSALAALFVAGVSGHVQRESHHHHKHAAGQALRGVDQLGYPLSGRLTDSHKYVDPSVVGDVSKETALWSSWKARMKKSYNSAEEEEFRFLLFQNTLERVVRKNAKLPKNKPNYGLNGFADMDPEEWRGMYLSTNPVELKKEQYKGVQVNKPKKSVDALPSNWDWRSLNVVSYVKDQGQCGSCWAFSVTETVESAIAIKANNTLGPDLSPQQIVDCDWFNGNQGCNGGDPAVTYPYVIQYGMMTDSEYPYFSGDSGSNGTCSYVAAQATAHIKKMAYATPPCSTGACANQDDSLLAQNLYENGPTGIIVDASNWQDYTFGSFSDCASDYAAMDHGVQVVGWSSDFERENGAPFTTGLWLVRNSWADSWGDEGYIMLLGSQYQNNTCGISNEAINAFA